MSQIGRSFLFAPGNHARRVEKALTLGADAVILDLEDAVAVAEKVSTRALVTQALGTGALGTRSRRCRGYVRVNAMSTEWGYGDMVAVVVAGVDGLVIPKVESADEIKAAEWVIGALERERGLAPLDIIPIIETGLGYTRMEVIARAGRRVRRVAFGAGDFTLDLAIDWTRDELELLPYRSQFVAVSRAAGLDKPLDTVWTDLRDPEGFERSAAAGRGLGFGGKLCIHPDQVPVTNRLFSPAPEAVAQARRVIAAFEQAEANGLASIQLDGKFIDYPIVHAARAVLAHADAIAASETPA